MHTIYVSAFCSFSHYMRIDQTKKKEEMYSLSNNKKNENEMKAKKKRRNKGRRM